MSCEYYNAKLLPLCKTADFTQKQKNYTNPYNTTKQWNYANTRVLRTNSLAGRFKLKQSALPVRFLTAGAATLQSIHNVFSQTFSKHYACLLYYYAKNFPQFTQTLRKYNLITQDTDFYTDITQYIYAKITPKLCIHYANRLRKIRRYYANTN